MKSNVNIDEFRSVLDLFTGKVCWSFVAGKGAGSHVSFALGAKIPRKARIDNSTLTKEQQLYRGELELFLIDCFWELRSSEIILCDCTNDNSKDGPILSGLSHVLGKKLLSVQISNSSFDLVIQFEDELELFLFCNPYIDTQGNDPDESYGQYDFFTRDIAVGVEGNVGNWQLFKERLNR